MNFLSESKIFRSHGTKIVKVREWTDANDTYIYRCPNLERKTLPIVAVPIQLNSPARLHQRLLPPAEDIDFFLYDSLTGPDQLLLAVCDGVVMLLCCDSAERTVRPLMLRAVTPFAEPEKSLNAIDGLTIISSDLVKQFSRFRLRIY